MKTGTGKQAAFKKNDRVRHIEHGMCVIIRVRDDGETCMLRRCRDDEEYDAALEDCRKVGGTRKDSRPKDNRPKPGGHAERWRILNNFVDFTLRELLKHRKTTTLDMAVWLVLYRESKNGTACVSQRQIGQVLGIRPNTINKAIKRLEQAGLVKVVKEGRYPKRSARYRVGGLLLTQ